MNATGITCELVDERDLDTRYLAGQLGEQEAEAFEAHFFGCERCWGLVQQGAAVRSAFQPDAALPVPASHSRRWWGLAAAAGIAAVAFGLWRTGGLSGPLPEDVLRGGDERFVITPQAGPETVAASWPRLPEADVYQVRLYTSDGAVVVERQTGDTAITLPVESVPSSEELFWQVQALDRLRKPVARSDLTKALPVPVAP